MAALTKTTDPYVARLVEVARAYYLDNQTQAEIARSLGISRSLVSRHLTAAREMGIVDIRIVAPDESVDSLGLTLRQRFPHLRDVVIAPTYSQDEATIRLMIGRTAANYIVNVIQSGQRIALGCGRTLWEMVSVLGKLPVSDVTVVQAMGNIGHEVHKIDYNEIARQTADVLGGDVIYVSAPAILGRGSGCAHELVRANPMLQYALALARDAEVYIVGIGSLESDELYTRSGLIQYDELDQLRNYVVGDICARFFDLSGRVRETPFEDRVVGIELDDLRNATYSIALAGGCDKVAPLLGALRGKFVNVVISDERTIEMVLAADDESAGLSS